MRSTVMDRRLGGRASQVMRAAVVVLTTLVVGCGGGSSGSGVGDGGTEAAAGLPDPGVRNPAADVRSALLDRSSQAVLAEPGLPGREPMVGAPDLIDASAPHDSAIGEFDATMSPRGHAVASWILTATCNASSYRTSGDCRYVVASRRLAGQDWEPPVRVGDTPAPLPKAIINDRGDVAMTWTAERRDAGGMVRSVQGVLVMAAASNRFSAPLLFDDIVLPDNGYVGMTLDRSGNIVFIAEALAGGRKQVVARRGSVASGIGGTELLGDGGADVTIEGITGGLNGQAVVLWQQAVGGAQGQFAAWIDGPGQAWQVADLGAPGPGQNSLLTTSDNGDFLRYDLASCTALTRWQGAWQPRAALPAGLCQNTPSFQAAIARTGDVVGGRFSATQTAGNTGQWLAYSAQRQALTRAMGNQPADHLLGTPSTLGGQLLIAENGIAALVSVNTFDTLPSATAPAGTNGRAANLWLTYLRLP